MFARLFTAHLEGIQPLKVEVEINIFSTGLPSFSIVGLAETSVKESKERVKSTLKNLGINLFAKPITINLAPADFKKEGTHYDLPIALGLIQAAGYINYDLQDTLILGELSLDGKIRSIRGALAFTIFAKESGFKKIFIPKDNLFEAAMVKDIEIFGFEHIDELLKFLKGEHFVAPVKPEQLDNPFIPHHANLDFADIKGQFAAKRAAEIAAAGIHNLIMIGSPGSGKTMIAKRLPTIMPDLSEEEMIETTKIHSVAGKLDSQLKIITYRPFISPHSTSSDIAIIGGGKNAMPGAVSLAHNGILFFDELLEFKRSVLEALRQPLEDRVVTISRANRTVTYPANFMFVAACNPCPCGYLGDKKKECVCTQTQIQRYRAKLSGPLMDRIDIQVQVSAIDAKDLANLKPGEPSSSIKKRVEKAHEIQKQRFKDEKINFNSQMDEKLIKKFCHLDDTALNIMKTAAEKLGLSARAYSKILKVARTIADLNESEEIKPVHLTEAIQYRFLDKQNNFNIGG